MGTHPSQHWSNRRINAALEADDERWRRCPVCGRGYEDCTAYLRDEGVAAGADPADYCSRGTLRSRETANGRTRLVALPTLTEESAS